MLKIFFFSPVIGWAMMGQLLNFNVKILWNKTSKESSKSCYQQVFTVYITWKIIYWHMHWYPLYSLVRSYFCMLNDMYFKAISCTKAAQPGTNSQMMQTSVYTYLLWMLPYCEMQRVKKYMVKCIRHLKLFFCNT